MLPPSGLPSSPINELQPQTPLPNQMLRVSKGVSGKRRMSLNSINLWNLRSSSPVIKDYEQLEKAWKLLVDFPITLPNTKEELPRFDEALAQFMTEVEKETVTLDLFLVFCLKKSDAREMPKDVLDKISLLLYHYEKCTASEGSLLQLLKASGSLHSHTLPFLKGCIRSDVVLHRERETLFREGNNTIKIMIIWFKEYFYQWNKKILPNDFLHCIEHSDEPIGSLALSLLRSIKKELEPVRCRQGDLFEILTEIKQGYESIYEKRISPNLLYGTIFFLRIINLSLIEPHKWGLKGYDGQGMPPQRSRDLIHLLQIQSNGKLLDSDLGDEVNRLLDHSHQEIITLIMNRI